MRHGLPLARATRVSRPLRVHLTGGEQTGWALDADVATTRSALLSLPESVALTPLEEAEVVHSVWEEPILRMDERRLDGKRIVCHVCNELMRTFEMPCMTRAGARVGLWVPISREAEANLLALGQRSVYIPYTVDTALFTELIPDGLDRAALRARWGVPQDAYVVSNFMRDSRADDLSLPKPQKGVELLLEIFKGLWSQGLPIHVLLAGPRRHWLRARLREAGVPFTFVGREEPTDDVGVNILTAGTINLLYHLSDLHLVTSRWEGGPRAVLEAGATRTPILCTPVGMACDILEPGCLFRSVDEGVARVAADVRAGALRSAVERHFRRVRESHVPEANVRLLRGLYAGIHAVPVFRTARDSSARRGLPPWRRVTRRLAAVAGLARTALKLSARPGSGLCIGLWHEARAPLHDGEGQFMRALRDALLRQGVRVLWNRMSGAVDVHLCDAARFDVALFEHAARHRPLRMIHRVGGPSARRRGSNRAGDERVHDVNRKLASATAFQSAWSFLKLKELGLDFVRPMIIRSAADRGDFHPATERSPISGRAIRLITVASPEHNGAEAAVCQWLDDHLDGSRFQFTVVGAAQRSFRALRHEAVKDARGRGDLLRSHDLYIAAGGDDTAPALLEALSCGLPALYVDQAGHGEIVGFAGLPFAGTDDVLPQLDRLAANLEAFRNCIWLPAIDDIARQYLELARLLVEDVP